MKFLRILYETLSSQLAAMELRRAGDFPGHFTPNGPNRVESFEKRNLFASLLLGRTICL